MGGLLSKTLRSVQWSFIGDLGQQIARFGIGIILARILSPSEYGLIGMIAIFIVLGDTLVESGFSQAIVQKKDISEIELSSVFFFNIFLSLIVFIALWISSDYIANFFQEEQLSNILIVLGFGIIVRSIAITHSTIFVKNLQFKQLSVIKIFSTLISAIVAIPMALNGNGVWSLVALTLSKDITFSTLIWLKSSWSPILRFEIASMYKMFRFGSRILGVSLLDTIFMNIYQVLIGKFFSASDLGFYSRAVGYRNLISKNVLNVINSVAFPAFSAMNNSVSKEQGMVQMKRNYKRMAEVTLFVTIPLLINFGFISKQFIVLLVTDKWIASAPYLEALCYAGLFYPIHGVQVSIMKALGHVNQYFILMVIHKVTIVLTILLLFKYGIMGLVVSQIVTMALVYIIGCFFITKQLGYKFHHQIFDQIN